MSVIVTPRSTRLLEDVPSRRSQLRQHVVIQTKPGAERYCFEFLTGGKLNDLSGGPVEVYYPQVLHEIRHAGRKSLQARPFLSRLMFVAADTIPSMSFLRNAPGVSSLLPGADGMPAVATQDVLDAIRAREEAVVIGGKQFRYIRLEADLQPRRFRENTPVVVHTESGDMDALFRHYQGEYRAVVFVQLMNRQMRASVRVSQLEAISPFDLKRKQETSKLRPGQRGPTRAVMRSTSSQ